MATRKSVIITDDLDGSENAKTLTFAFDGVTYEIDLAPKNRAKLEKALRPFIDAGRRVTGRRRFSSPRTSRSAADSAAVRAWAKATGLGVSERGRISADVLRQYKSAQ